MIIRTSASVDRPCEAARSRNARWAASDRFRIVRFAIGLRVDPMLAECRRCYHNACNLADIDGNTADAAVGAEVDFDFGVFVVGGFVAVASLGEAIDFD